MNDKNDHYKSVSGEYVSPWRMEIVYQYKQYQNSAAWKRNREKCLSSNSNKCVHCGKTATIAHHVQYDNWALGELELSDLEPVCGKCHAKIHKTFITPFFARRDCEISWFSEDDLEKEYRKLFDQRSKK